MSFNFLVKLEHTYLTFVIYQRMSLNFDFYLVSEIKSVFIL